MFQLSHNPVSKFRRWRRLRSIAKTVRAGIVPQGVSKEEIWEALKATRPKSVMEAFGFLSAKHYRDGKLVADLGLQGVKEVTTAFVEYLVDAMMDSASVMDDFHWHGMGDGSTDETDTETALVNSKETRTAGSQTHGTTSNIYKSVETLTATDAYTAIEHGIFDTETGGVMLDRTKVGSPPNLVTDDEVEWTYELTINAGG